MRYDGFATPPRFPAARLRVGGLRLSQAESSSTVPVTLNCQCQPASEPECDFFLFQFDSEVLVPSPLPITGMPRARQVIAAASHRQRDSS